MIQLHKQGVQKIIFSNTMFILLKSQIKLKMTFSNLMFSTTISDLTKNAFFNSRFLAQSYYQKS